MLGSPHLSAEACGELDSHGARENDPIFKKLLPCVKYFKEDV